MSDSLTPGSNVQSAQKKIVQAAQKKIVQGIATELGVQARQVAAAVALLDEGSTVPFIARYRKEATGNLDDTQLRTLEERQGLQAGCPEEIAYEQGWISAGQLAARAEMFAKNSYGDYLAGLLG